MHSPDGRSPACSLILQYESEVRKHAYLLVRDGSVADLNSALSAACVAPEIYTMHFGTRMVAQNQSWALALAIGQQARLRWAQCDVRLRGHVVQEQFLEEVELGAMVERRQIDAEKRFANLLIVSLGTIEKKDGYLAYLRQNTGINVNSRIRIGDQLRNPTAGDLRTLVWCQVLPLLNR
eukprot:s1024_g23.t1